MANYRLDSRTESEFKKDIKNCHIKEAEIAVRLCIAKKIDNGLKEWPTLKPNGCDFTGQFIKDTKKVNIDPDFDIDGTLVEITQSDKVCNRYFHEKVTKISNCLKENHYLVFVNGISSEEEPQYLLLSPKELEFYTVLATKKYGEVKHPGTGNKPGFRYEIDWFQDLWRSLPKITGKIPEEYLKILNLKKV